MNRWKKQIKYGDKLIVSTVQLIEPEIIPYYTSVNEYNFETMVFFDTINNGYQELNGGNEGPLFYRYQTKDQAELGHQEIIEFIEKIKNNPVVFLVSPEKDIRNIAKYLMELENGQV